jgi:hypothetical protein
VTLIVLEKKNLEDLASFRGISLPVWKIFGIMRINYSIIVSEKIFEELLTRKICHDIRSE